MWPEISELETAMQSLLTLLEDPLSEGLDQAWARCDRAGAALEQRLSEKETLDPEGQARLRSGLEGLVRLNAIARQSLLRGQEQLTKQLGQTRAKSAQVRAYSKGPSATGGSCNIAG